MASYVEKMTVKLVRKKHQVSFRTGESPSEIIEQLMKVPIGSMVDDVDTNEEGVTSIIFHDEACIKE